MTTTTGVAPATPTAHVAITRREGLARPAISGRARLGSWVVGLDVLVGVVAAGSQMPQAPALAGIVMAWPAGVALAGGYARLCDDPRRVPGRALTTAALGVATAIWVLAALTTGPAGTATPTADPRTLTPLALAAGTLAGSVVARLLVAAVAPARPSSAVLVGTRSQVRELLREAGRARGRAFEAVAICLQPSIDDLSGVNGDTDPPDATAWPVAVWAGADETLLAAVRSSRADCVIVAPGPGIGPVELRRWGAWLQHEAVRLLVSPGLRDVAAVRLATTTWGGTRLLEVWPAPLTGASRLLKQLVDRVVAALLLVLLAPLLGVLALVIRADSPGPAFYRQTRVGRSGRPLTVYKLRTMCLGADAIRERLGAENESDHGGVLFKIRQDPRLTRLGPFLRRSSLDELPQLLNVVRGEMSLIGPRPALPAEVLAYAPDVLRRLDVRPGLTGLWQVSGRSDLSWEDTVRLDLQYVDNWSWLLDLRIAVLTVRAVLSRRGAY